MDAQNLAEFTCAMRDNESQRAGACKWFWEMRRPKSTSRVKTNGLERALHALQGQCQENEFFFSKQYLSREDAHSERTLGSGKKPSSQ